LFQDMFLFNNNYFNSYVIRCLLLSIIRKRKKEGYVDNGILSKQNANALNCIEVQSNIVM